MTFEVSRGSTDRVQDDLECPHDVWPSRRGAGRNQPRPVLEEDEKQRNDVHGGQNEDDGTATEQHDAEMARMHHDDVPINGDDRHVDEVFEDYQKFHRRRADPAVLFDRLPKRENIAKPFEDFRLSSHCLAKSMKTLYFLSERRTREKNH